MGSSLGNTQVSCPAPVTAPRYTQEVRRGGRPQRKIPLLGTSNPHRRASMERPAVLKVLKCGEKLQSDWGNELNHSLRQQQAGSSFGDQSSAAGDVAQQPQPHRSSVGLANALPTATAARRRSSGSAARTRPSAQARRLGAGVPAPTRVTLRRRVPGHF